MQTPSRANLDHLASVASINQNLKASKLCLKFAHINARSLPGHIDELSYVFVNTDFDVIGISETWLTKRTPPALSSIPGYKVHRSDRKQHSTRTKQLNCAKDPIGGGVAIVIKNHIKSKIISSSENGKVDHILVELNMCGGKFLVCCFYNPPPTSEKDAAHICEILLEYVHCYDHVIILGDFNFNMLENNHFKPYLLSLSLKYINDKPTRFASLLDLFILPENNTSRVLSLGQVSISGLDHDLIYLSYNYRPNRSKPEYITCPDLSSINHQSLHFDVLTAPWQLIFSMCDVNSQADYINKLIIGLYNKHVKAKKVLVRDPVTPWISTHIINQFNKRDEAYKVWKRHPTLSNRIIYNQIRNHTTLVLREAKRRYFKDQLNVDLPSGKLWKNIKKIGILNNSSKSISNFSVHDHNLFFSKIPIYPVTLPLPDPNVRIADNFSFLHVTENDAWLAFNSITSNAVGSDGISLRFLKLIFLDILKYITYFLNHCITSATFPNCWKCALVIPTPKKEDPSSLSDFRPISILPVMSKVFEILLKHQIIRHLDENNLLNPLQSGFRSKHSTSTALLKITNDISADLDQSKFSILTLLDFTKAFDSLNHLCLLQKLQLHFFFSSPAIKLIYSYLVERSQKVRLGNEISSSVTLVSGVPQGSILGPLLFSMYINDLPDCLNYCRYHLYADDCQLYLSDKIANTLNAFSKLNDDLSKVLKWSIRNALALNAKKTQILFICSNPALIPCLPDIFLDGEKIEISKTVKNLGLIINSNLTWSDHINELSRKIHYSLYSLRSTANFTPFSVRMKLVKALLVPLFLYCDVIWYNTDFDSKRKLEVTFNSCLRYIYGLKWNDHISQFRDSIFGCPLSSYHAFRVANFIYKILNTESPKYLSDLLIYGSSRRTCNLKFPSYNKQLRGRSFFVHGVSSIWNNIPTSIRSTSSPSNFKVSCLAYINSNRRKFIF